MATAVAVLRARRNGVFVPVFAKSTKRAMRVRDRRRFVMHGSVSRDAHGWFNDRTQERERP